MVNSSLCTLSCKYNSFHTHTKHLQNMNWIVRKKSRGSEIKAEVNSTEDRKWWRAKFSWRSKSKERIRFFECRFFQLERTMTTLSSIVINPCLVYDTANWSKWWANSHVTWISFSVSERKWGDKRDKYVVIWRWELAFGPAGDNEANKDKDSSKSLSS